jgi:membrane-associated phospholipid phosphatase
LRDFWQFVTDLGDSAVTLPLAALMLLFLLLSHWRRAAAALAVSLVAGGFAIALLKLALQSCGYHLLHTTLINPSGHVAMSTMVYGALAILLGGALSGWRRATVHGVFTLLIGGIALSRLTLHVHNPGEVLAGLSVGVGALVLYRQLRGATPSVSLKAGRLALSALLLMALMHGARWPIEDEIRSIVALIRAGVPRCTIAREPLANTLNQNT